MNTVQVVSVLIGDSQIRGGGRSIAQNDAEVLSNGMAQASHLRFVNCNNNHISAMIKEQINEHHNALSGSVVVYSYRYELYTNKQRK